MGTKANHRSIVNDAILKDLNDAIPSLDHGKIIITVNNAKITQIEVVEKKHFHDVWHVEEGGGI